MTVEHELLVLLPVVRTPGVNVTTRHDLLAGCEQLRLPRT